ncbi:hypothetical protein GF323_06440 [Candidatus Woesearchaeota archaeon]|nr:hypothetical protein [Candidatus Woesearchaeota archaeon]
MKGMVLCDRGIEDIVKSDIKEIIGRESKLFSGFLVFNFEDNEELCRLAYLCQSIRKVLVLLDDFKFQTQEYIITRAGKLRLGEWLDKEKSFKVEALAHSDINSGDLKGRIGKSIIDNIKGHKQRVNLDNPDVVVFAFINKNRAFLGIDFSGKDIGKREYRIFSAPKNIKSTIAYAMTRLSGFKRGDTLVDPFCLSGSVVIEAALYENSFSPHYFDKNSFLFNKLLRFDFEKADKETTKSKGSIFGLDEQFRNIDSSRKNAKIAGINKAINFSRLNVEWLDTKFEKGSVDRVVTCMPNITRYSNEKEILKIYREFFYQAAFVLSKKGSIVICTTNTKKIAEEAKKNKFKLDAKKEVWQGKQKLALVKFVK